MISDIMEYRKHKGTPDEIRFRRATEEEEKRCSRAEKTKVVGIITAGVVLLCLCIFAVHMFFNYIGSDIIRYAPIVFVAVAVISLIWRIFDYKKSESFEIADGITVVIKRFNKRTYASVWCEEAQVYLPKLRYLSVFHLYTNMPVLIVKGDRGEGKKPHYFILPADKQNF